MSDYNKATNFATKDSLLTGNPAKAIKGTELDNEFNAIAGAIATKAEQGDITDAVNAALALLSGRIVQTVQSTYTTSANNNSSSFVSTGHTLTITPTSATSKILILQSGNLFQTDEYQPSQNALLTVYRNSTNLATGSNNFFVQASSGYANSIYVGESLSVIDTPNTVSATTYTVYTRIAGSQANAVYTGFATLIAMEIL